MTSRNASSIIVVAAAAIAATAFAQATVTPARDGKAIFLENKCNTCHSVTALKVEVKKAAEAEKSDDKVKPPDLSSVGLERKADWMARFLMKKEAMNGEKHKKLFKGSEADLKTLTAWLETQKAPKKKGVK